MATRRERVVLTLDDDFSSKMARAAAATALLRKNLDSLSGDAVRSGRGMDTAQRSVTRLGASGDRSGNQIDRLSGRIRLFADAAAVLGPAFIPVAGLAIPAMAGLAAQFGFAAIAGGTAMAAFQGVGGALEAMNKAHLEPTTENLQAAKIAMQAISPEARQFVRQLREMAPAMKELRDVAAAGLFPGLTEGLQSMESLLPKVERILGAVSGELGEIAADAGASLASERWADFFDFLATDAPSALRDMATAAGNTAHAMAEMWMAFDPLNDDFSAWMVDATDRLDEWASGISKTDGFAEFIDYLRTTGPQVADTLGAIGNAFVQIVQAAAPLAGPILAGVEAFAKAVAAVADSDLGTPIFGMIAALSALNLAMRTTAALSRTTFGGPALGAMRAQGAGLRGLRSDWVAYNAVTRTAQGRSQATAGQMIASRQAAARLGTSLRSTATAAGKAGALVGGLALVTTGLGDEMGVTNTASLALMGSMAGPWGAAIGGAVGVTLDLAHANDDLKAAVTSANAAIDTGNVDQMAAAYKRLASQIRETREVPGALNVTPSATLDRIKGITAVVTGELRAAQQAQAGIAGAINGAAAANALTGITDGFTSTSAAAAAATSSVKAFQNALAGMGGALSARERLRQFTESVLDANAAVRENGATLTKSGDAFKGHARAGLESQRMLDRIAASAVSAAADMKPLAGARFLQNARQDFVRVAHGMGWSRAAARALARQLLVLGGIRAKPRVDEQGADASKKRIGAMRAEIARIKSKMVKMDEKGAAAARARIAALRAAIAALHDKTIYITTIRRAGGEGGFDGVRKPASGGQMIARYPGETRGPRDDTIPAMLSHREYVQPVHAVDYYGERFMEDLRRHRFPKPPGYRDGGLAQRESSRARRYASGGLVGSSVNVAAPNVNVASPGVRVFIDGKEVRAIVDDRIADYDDMAGMARRANV